MHFIPFTPQVDTSGILMFHFMKTYVTFEPGGGGGTHDIFVRVCAILCYGIYIGRFRNL